jgi:hypothetical protein
VEGAPLPAITPKDLKDFMREKSKENLISASLLDSLYKVLPKPDRDE